MKRSIVMAAAWLEIVLGASFIAVPDVPCQLLFGVTLEGVNILVARGAGVALLGLGIACLPSKIAGSHRGAVLGLLAFNVGATILFTWVAVATSFRGVLLCPFIILHAVIAAALLPQFLNKGTLAT
jgi:hypothetical protein